MPNLKWLSRNLQKAGYTCMVFNGSEPRFFERRGVADLYDLWKDDPSFLQGASVVDKVVGRGAAALMIAGGIANLHTQTICSPALEMFHQAGIWVEYDNEVEYIRNQEGNDWCPIEWLCRDCERVEQMLPLIEQFMRNMRSDQP